MPRREGNVYNYRILRSEGRIEFGIGDDPAGEWGIDIFHDLGYLAGGRDPAVIEKRHVRADLANYFHFVRDDEDGYPVRIANVAKK